MNKIKLNSTNARAARTEASRFRPCRITGFDASGKAVYLTMIREAGNKAPVATALVPDKRAVSFECEPIR